MNRQNDVNPKTDLYTSTEYCPKSSCHISDEPHPERSGLWGPLINRSKIRMCVCSVCQSL